MLTRKRWTPPIIPSNVPPEVQAYLREQNKSISDYLLSLEGKGGTVLDEIRTWTPVDVSGASLSFTSNTGKYLLVGGLMIASGTVTYPATASGANTAIGGLPLKVMNDQGARGGGIISYCTETTAASIIPKFNDVYLEIMTTAGAQVTNATMSGDQIYFCAIYPTA